MPTDAEVEAAARALAERFGEPPVPWGEWSDIAQDEFRDDARAALMAAWNVKEEQ